MALTSPRTRFAAVILVAVALIIAGVVLNPARTVLHGADIAPDTVVARVQTSARGYSDEETARRKAGYRHD